ncbi:hypothetical protein MferCBS31731_003932 [Microsporum ferrugineum]
MDPFTGLAEALSQCQHHYSEALKLIQETSKKNESTRRELELASQKLKEYDIDQVRQEQRIQAISKENAALKGTVDELKQELRDQDSARLQDDDAVFEKGLLDEAKRRDPEDLIYKFDSSPGIVDYDLYARVSGFYCDLYAENINLIKSFCKLRRKHKATNEKLAQWNRLLEKTIFETVVNGEAVTFRRVGQGYPKETIIAESPSLPPIKRHMPQSCDGYDKDPSSSQPPDHRSDPASTQSQDLRYDERRLPPPESPDTPTIVKERPVRRQRARTPTHCPVKVEQSPTGIGTADKPFDIKSKPVPSSPAQVAAIPQYAIHYEERRYEHVSSPTLDPIESPLPKPRFAVLHDRRSPLPVLQEDQLELNAGQQIESHGKKRGRRVLQSVNANVTPIRKPKDHTEPQSKRRKPYYPRSAYAIPHVAEDNEAEEYLAGRRALRSSNAAGAKESTPAAKMRQTRLQDLLETNYTPRPILLSTPPQAATAKSSKFATPRTPNDNIKILKTSSIQQPNSAQHSESREVVSPSQEVDEDDEILPQTRYRNRPLNELSLEHFKLNPNRNQGLDYAFDEVVRDKSMRKQLRGCLRQECCGPLYRNMAKDELGEEPRSLNTLTRADLDLLQEDLGSNYAQFLEGKSPIEIRDILIEAKASILSNKFSKHRSAHRHGRSPPGYWRTDMPNTQEIEQDRMMAQKFEQEKILDRYKEACKDNGYWKFADE